MEAFSTGQVLGMAADAASAKAGQAQAITSRWSGIGHDDEAAWGECQGSGSSPYRTAAALTDGASRCSCPSRKAPCKHVLGLLLLLADGAVPPGTAPDWARDWLAARAARQARPVRRAAAEPADPLAARRRASNRESKVDAGVAELRRWLADLIQTGLAAAQTQPWPWWEQQARRMIDAQARGLAGQVRRMASTAAMAGHRADWPDRMLDQVGHAHLLCEAWTRRDQLPEPTRRALRIRIGYTLTADEVVASGERLTDTWAVLGQRTDDDGNLRSLRQWLYGERTGAVVTFLSFASGPAALEPGLPSGMRTEATLAAYPGSLPPRVLIVDRQQNSEPIGRLPGAADWDGALAGPARLLAVDPWADVTPVAVRGITVLPSDDARSPWLLRDAAGRAVPIAAAAETSWKLLAISGGQPLDLVGEWDGFGFSPQAAARSGTAGRLVG